MITKQDIINLIVNNVYANSSGLITGPVMQQVLLSMVDFTEDFIGGASHWAVDENGNLYTTKNVYSLGEVSAYGAGVGSGGGGAGTVVFWGATENGVVELTVDGATKQLLLPAALTTGLALKQDLLTPGIGIDISENGVISVTGGSGGGGSNVSWGAESDNFIVLEVEEVPKTVALSGHTHTIADITNLQSSLNAKQNTLTAGTGISISNNVISYTGGPGGSSVSWGATSNNYSPLTVEGAAKTVALSGHTHTYGNINSITGSRLLGRYSTTTGEAQLITIGTDLTLNSSTGALSATDTVYTHPTSGVTAGTYKSVTVNALGHITAGSNPTTLSGYGITNAVANSRTVTAGNGLTGGGALSSNITLTLATPSSITLSSTNSVAASSHSHSLVLGGTSSQYLNGATSLVTIPTITAGNGMSGGGQLTANRTLTLGTPGTLTASTTNAVTTSSHTHSITTTTVGASNTIVQTDSAGAVRGNSLKVGAEWSIELSGTELQFKKGGTLTHRLLADGSIVGLGEVTAYGADTGGDGVALLKTGGTMTGTLVLDTGASLGASNKALNLLGNSFKYNSSDVLTKANTANNITTEKITLGNGWTIEQTSASLTIRRNGVVKGTFNA